MQVLQCYAFRIYIVRLCCIASCCNCFMLPEKVFHSVIDHPLYGQSCNGHDGRQACIGCCVGAGQSSLHSQLAGLYRWQASLVDERCRTHATRDVGASACTTVHPSPASRQSLEALDSMPGAFEPGPRSHNRHFTLVAGSGALLLLVGGYFGVGALSRLFGRSKEEKNSQQ